MGAEYYRARGLIQRFVFAARKGIYAEPSSFILQREGSLPDHIRGKARQERLQLTLCTSLLDLFEDPFRR